MAFSKGCGIWWEPSLFLGNHNRKPLIMGSRPAAVLVLWACALYLRGDCGSEWGALKACGFFGGLGMYGVRSSCLAMVLAALCGCQLSMPNLSSHGHLGAGPVRFVSSGMLISAPHGYCFDLDTLTNTKVYDFVVLLPCAESKNAPLLLTVAASRLPEQGEGFSVADLSGFLKSDQGKAHLARHAGAPPEILWSGIESGVYIVHASDGAVGQPTGMSAEYWRAVNVKDGRVMSVTASGAEGAAATQAGVKGLVLELAKEL
jgi:hypothetical protein